MMKNPKRIGMLMIAILFSTSFAMSQEKKLHHSSETSGETYLLERQMSDTSEENLQRIATGAQNLVEEIGPQVEWLHSYVTGDKMICVFRYETKEALAEHAKRAGLQISDLRKVKNIIGPETAEN